MIEHSLNICLSRTCEQTVQSCSYLFDKSYYTLTQTHTRVFSLGLPLDFHIRPMLSLAVTRFWVLFKCIYSIYTYYTIKYRFINFVSKMISFSFFKIISGIIFIPWTNLYHLGSLVTKCKNSQAHRDCKRLTQLKESDVIFVKRGLCRR